MCVLRVASRATEANPSCSGTRSSLEMSTWHLGSTGTVLACSTTLQNQPIHSNQTAVLLANRAHAPSSHRSLSLPPFLVARRQAGSVGFFQPLFFFFFSFPPERRTRTMLRVAVLPKPTAHCMCLSCPLLLASALTVTLRSVAASLTTPLFGCPGPIPVPLSPVFLEAQMPAVRSEASLASIGIKQFTPEEASKLLFSVALLSLCQLIRSMAAHDRNKRPRSSASLLFLYSSRGIDGDCVRCRGRSCCRRRHHARCPPVREQLCSCAHAGVRTPPRDSTSKVPGP